MSDQRLSDRQIVDFALGELSPDEREQVEAMLAASPAEAGVVARVVDDLRGMVETMRADVSEKPTTRAVRLARRAVREARAPVPARPGPLETVGRFLADLLFDSRSTPALAGYRSATTEYRLAYGADDVRVDMHVNAGTGDSTDRTVRGRVSGRDGVRANSITVESVETGRAAAGVKPDDSGRFVIQVAPGQYVLVVDLGPRVMTTKSIVLD